MGREVLGSNPAATSGPGRVALGGHSSSSLTIPRCKIETRPRNSELTLRIITCKQGKSAAMRDPPWL